MQGPSEWIMTLACSDRDLRSPFCLTNRILGCSLMPLLALSLADKVDVTGLDSVVTIVRCLPTSLWTTSVLSIVGFRFLRRGWIVSISSILLTLLCWIAQCSSFVWILLRIVLVQQLMLYLCFHWYPRAFSFTEGVVVSQLGSTVCVGCLHVIASHRDCSPMCVFWCYMYAGILLLMFVNATIFDGASRVSELVNGLKYRLKAVWSFVFFPLGLAICLGSDNVYANEEKSTNVSLLWWALELIRLHLVLLAAWLAVLVVSLMWIKSEADIYQRDCVWLEAETRRTTASFDDSPKLQTDSTSTAMTLQNFSCLVSLFAGAVSLSNQQPHRGVEDLVQTKLNRLAGIKSTVVKSRVVLRKYFHFVLCFLMALAMVLKKNGFLAFGLLGALWIFLFVETVRLSFHDDTFGKVLARLLDSIIDERDRNGIIVTHVFLLLG
eukprot:GHVQ01003169.1.p1 GENE.GHVQ01003169.1~~GHVQ01003169.1.p1  ORF type:complete len:436 (+),score=32.87 GHVQ01003169.1:173-1480(+)